MRKPKSRRILQSVGHELKHDEPSIVGHTRRKFGPERAKRQKTAILLSKSRDRGARIRRAA
jgi:hypothetical protein